MTKILLPSGSGGTRSLYATPHWLQSHWRHGVKVSTTSKVVVGGVRIWHSSATGYWPPIFSFSKFTYSRIYLSVCTLSKLTGPPSWSIILDATPPTRRLIGCYPGFWQWFWHPTCPTRTFELGWAAPHSWNFDMTENENNPLHNSIGLLSPAIQKIEPFERKKWTYNILKTWWRDIWIKHILN